MENKQKFFGVYYGQDILRYDNATVSTIVGCNVLDLTRNNIKHAWLELRPLSLITDEDAIETFLKNYEVFNYGSFSKYVLRPLKSNQPMKIHVSRNDEHVFTFEFSEYSLSSLSADYLRSLGYALPWMGISVEEQVSRGWVKLKVE